MFLDPAFDLLGIRDFDHTALRPLIAHSVGSNANTVITAVFLHGEQTRIGNRYGTMTSAVHRGLRWDEDPGAICDG